MRFLTILHLRRRCDERVTGFELWSREFMFRIGVDPLRCAVHPSRKPGGGHCATHSVLRASPGWPSVAKKRRVLHARPMNSRDHPVSGATNMASYAEHVSHR